MMREKIEEILKFTNVSAEEIDALLAALGEGQEPVYQHRMHSSGWGDVDKAHYDAAPEHMRRILYTAPQPAPDVVAMLRKAKLRDEETIAGLQARIAELERVQGRLVAALESWNEVENYSAQYWSTPGAAQEITDAWAAAVGKRRAALDEVKKTAVCKHEWVQDSEHPSYHCCQLCGAVKQPAADQKGEQQ